MLEPHEKLGDEQRVLDHVDLHEQGLDGPVLRLVVAERCRSLPKPGQEALPRLPDVVDAGAEVDEPTQEHEVSPVVAEPVGDVDRPKGPAVRLEVVLGARVVLGDR